MKNTGSPPKNSIALFTSPARGENNRWIMPTTTTTEMKDGEYSTVWVNFLNRSPESWFTTNARIIGTGKAISRPSEFTVSVLTINRSNWNESKNRWKCSRPTHGLPKNPSAGL